MATGGRRRLYYGLAILVVLAIIGLLLAIVVPTSKSNGEASPQHGINVYVTDTCESAAVWHTNAVNEMKGIKSLGANAVAIAFPFYTTGLYASSVFVANQCNGPDQPTIDPQSPSPSRVAVLVHVAQAQGLQVLLRPLLQENNLDGQWRGDIEPANRPAWFASYENLLKPYLEMAQANDVNRFTISLELASLSKSSQWLGVIPFARKLYTGQLVFTTSWRGSLPHGAGEVHRHTSVAIDAYPGIPSVAPTATVAQLLSGWNAYLAAHPYGTADRNVTIDEVGIDATDGAYATPYLFVRGPFDQAIQANWFTAACQFSKEHKLGGIYFWGPQFTYNFGNLMTQPEPSQLSELQPTTQAAIRACFK